MATASKFLRQAASRPLEQLTIYKLGTATTDSDGNPRTPTRQVADTVYADLQPVGGSLHLLPVGSVVKATDLAYADPSGWWVQPGQVVTVQRADGSYWEVERIYNWGEYVLATLIPRQKS